VESGEVEKWKVESGKLNCEKEPVVERSEKTRRLIEMGILVLKEIQYD